MTGREKKRTPDEFWRDYENRIGEKVLARGLGRYLSGWEEFDAAGRPLWGLLIATEGGFRFHHFPQVNWFEALARLNSGWEAPREKTFFIPREQIIAAELRKETSWWKRLFTPSPPLLIIRYRTAEGTEAELLAETDSQGEGLIAGLRFREA
ncbi:MAG: hypothetical protein LBG10_04145 [Treponema sp.]|jgi:hypothetical protein|nr:hypothetical protein [Treponema sp.]